MNLNGGEIMTGKIKITFEPKTIKYSPVSFELEVENEKELVAFN